MRVKNKFVSPLSVVRLLLDFSAWTVEARIQIDDWFMPKMVM